MSMKLYQLNPVCNKNAGNLSVDEYSKGGWLNSFSEGLHSYYPSLIIENHYLHPGIHEKFILLRDGFTDVIHPCIKGKLHEKDFDIYSRSFLNYIKGIDDGVIVNHRPFTFMSLYLSGYMRHKPYIIQTHGEGTPAMSHFFDRNIRTFILHKLSRELLAPVKHYLAGSKFEVDSLSNEMSFTKTLFKGGIDFSKYKPFDKESEIRKFIVNGKVNLVYVGKFYRSKGVSDLLQTYSKLKEKNSNISLVCIGGSTSDELFDKVNQTADYVFTRISNSAMIEILRECDIYILPTQNMGKVYQCGGIGTSPIEAMALGIPVISNNLIHFQNLNDIGSVGVIPGDNYFKAILDVMNDLSSYNNVRAISQTYYDNKTVFENYLNVAKSVWGRSNVNS